MKYVNTIVFVLMFGTSFSQIYFSGDTMFIRKSLTTNEVTRIAQLPELQTILAGKASISHSHAYNSLTGLPTIPTNTNQLVNGSGFLVAADISGKVNVSDTANQMSGYVRKNTTIPFASGGISAAAATPATTGTMTVSMTTSVITITPTGACTFNASGGVPGQVVTFAITTSGTTSFTLTWGTGFRKTGTLATGTTSARFFSVTFICISAGLWQETGRTAAQT